MRALRALPSRASAEEPSKLELVSIRRATLVPKVSTAVPSAAGVLRFRCPNFRDDWDLVMLDSDELFRKVRRSARARSLLRASPPPLPECRTLGRLPLHPMRFGGFQQQGSGQHSTSATAGMSPPSSTTGGVE
jgi:hypothetical protein